LRILIVSQYFWPENFRITDLAMALKDNGHEVTVLTGMPNYPAGKVYEGYSWWSKRREMMGGIPIVRVPLFVRRESRSWQLALNYLSFVISGCLFGSWMLKKQSFDVVFTFEVSPVTVAIPAILMAKLKRAKHFFWVQDLWPESLSATGAVKSPIRLSIVSYMVKIIYRSCDRILIQSKALWSGVTTLELAKAVEWAIESDISGLYHVTNGKPINKYDLLMLFKKYTKRNIQIEAVSGRATDKSLLDTRKKRGDKIPDYDVMVHDMVSFIER